MEYKLILNSDEAHEILKAVELLMRLKIKQSFIFGDYVVGDNCPTQEEMKANDYVSKALGILFKDMPLEKYKDDEWYRLYNIYQVVRFALHQTEHPYSTGVDSNPPIQFTDVPLPRCEWSTK